jgi:hypothetical protein
VSLQITVAAPFKQMHVGELERNHFVFFLALDRKWMNVEQANTVFRLGESAGLLGVRGGKIVPLFDLSTVTIPLGFRPGPEIFEAPDPLRDLVGRIASATGRDTNEVTAEMNRVTGGEFDGKLRPEAAAVLLARRDGVAWQDLLPALRESVLREK